MRTSSSKSLRPEVDDMFTFEAEDLVASVSHGLVDASFKDYARSLSLLGDSILPKFKEFVTTLDNCRSVSFGSEIGVFNLELKGFGGGITSVDIIPTWYQSTLKTMKAYNWGGDALSFVPTSLRTAISCFIEIASKREVLAKELDLCASINLLGREMVGLTPETAIPYLSVAGVAGYLSPWCRVIWKALSSGLSIEKAHYFALISHMTHLGSIDGYQEKWKYRRKLSISGS